MGHAREAQPVDLGPFHLVAPLGRGGMGEVWRATHRGDGTPVAVKVITKKYATKDVFLSAFQREVRAMAGLSHPHVLTVYDHGAVSAAAAAAAGGQLREGSPWLAMELAEDSLAPWVGRCDWPTLRMAMLDLLDALAYAHARGIIHRDLKPQNVLLARGVVRLADFGIAVSQSTPDEASTEGTPAYMAPEQIAGAWRDFGPPTDLFALACAAWALATGSPPYGAERQSRWKATGRAHEPPPPFRPVTPMPSDLEAWLQRALREDPGERFASAAAAAYALAGVRGELSGGAAAPPPPGAGLTLYTWTGGGAASTILEPHALPGATPELTDRGDDRPWAPQGPRGAASDVEVPPPPVDWHTGRASSRERLRGVGLGLYGLRHVPLVGRDAERDTLWAALRAVCGDLGPRAVIIEGEAGAGKTRLAGWLARRALELGLVELLEINHRDPPSAGDGLIPALRRHLRVQGLPRKALARRVRALLGLQSPRDVGAITELLQPLGEGESPDGVLTVALRAPAARDAAAFEIVRRLWARRPLVLLLDDAQWAGDGVRWVHQLLDTHPDAPLLALITVRAEALAVRPVEAEALSALRSRATVVPLGPLTGPSRVALVQELLGLSGPLAERVAARTGGNPLFATQLVGDWVERGVLIAGDEGFTLAEGAQVPIPDALHGLLSARLEHTLRGHGAPAWASLEVAALLGMEVAPCEWTEACLELGLTSSPALLEVLARSGLITARGDGWVFANGLLVECVLRIAQEQGRLDWERQAVVATLWRRGDALLGQGVLTDALLMLTRAEVAARDGRDPAAWIEVLIDLADCQRRLCAWEAAEHAASLVLERARGAGLRRLECRGTLVLGAMLADRARFAEAEALEEVGLALARALPDRQLEGRALSSLGLSRLSHGDHAGAIPLLEMALAAQRELGDRRGERNTLSRLGALWLERREHARAAEVYAEALSLSRAQGDRLTEGTVRRSLALIDLELGRLRAAIGGLVEAAVLLHAAGDVRFEANALGNLGLALTLLGANDRALALLDEALRTQLRIDNAWSVGMLHGFKGRALGQARRLGDALASYTEALRIHERMGNRRMEALHRVELAELLIQFDCLEEAEDHLARGIQAVEAHGAPVDRASAQVVRASLLTRSGRTSLARAALEAAEPLVYETGGASWARFLCHRAEAETRAGDREAALAALASAEEVARPLGEDLPWDLVQALAEGRAALGLEPAPWSSWRPQVPAALDALQRTTTSAPAAI